MTAVLPVQRGSMTPFPLGGETRAYELTLVAAPSAMTCAELLVKFAACKWRLDDTCAQELDEAAKGLMNHAVSAAPKQPTPKHVHLDSLSLVKFRLVLTPRAVVTEVWDSGAQAPVPFPVVAALDSGCRMPRPGHRVLWCAVGLRLSVPDEKTPTAASVPRRQRLEGPPLPSTALRDQELLRRILHGLHALDDAGS